MKAPVNGPAQPSFGRCAERSRIDYRAAREWDELASVIEAAWRTGFGDIPVMAQVAIANIRRGGGR